MAVPGGCATVPPLPWVSVRCLALVSSAMPRRAQQCEAQLRQVFPGLFRVLWEGLYALDLETSELSRLLGPPVPHPEAASPYVQPGQ